MDTIEWFAECKKLAAEDWEYYQEWYSFTTALHEGKTPKEAVDDCKEWLES